MHSSILVSCFGHSILFTILLPNLTPLPFPSFILSFLPLFSFFFTSSSILVLLSFLSFFSPFFTSSSILVLLSFLPPFFPISLSLPFFFSPCTLSSKLLSFFQSLLFAFIIIKQSIPLPGVFWFHAAFWPYSSSVLGKLPNSYPSYETTNKSTKELLIQ